MKNKIRIDKYLFEKNLVRSRNAAQELIKEKKIIHNGLIVEKTNQLVDWDAKIEIIENKQYVSRGAYKLLEAIKEFQVKLNGLIVLDIGSSTGGFAQVILENNPKHLYCVDVGINQLDLSIKKNLKVTNYEKTNFKNITNEYFKEKIDFITCDVSFISITKILKKIKELNWKNIEGIFLLKPQFELSYKEINQGKGKVKEIYLDKVINNFKNFCLQNNFKILKIIKSPILGSKKQNIEYLVWMEL